jgi:hypothetical protein
LWHVQTNLPFLVEQAPPSCTHIAHCEGGGLFPYWKSPTVALLPCAVTLTGIWMGVVSSAGKGGVVAVQVELPVLPASTVQAVSRRGRCAFEGEVDRSADRSAGPGL